MIVKTNLGVNTTCYLSCLAYVVRGGFLKVRDLHRVHPSFQTDYYRIVGSSAGEIVEKGRGVQRR